MNRAQENRWELLGIDNTNSTFIVQDMLFKKPRYFHVPMLTNVVVDDCFAYALTSSRKIMQINLETAKRKFVQNDIRGNKISFNLDPPQFRFQIS